MAGVRETRLSKKAPQGSLMGVRLLHNVAVTFSWQCHFVEGHIRAIHDKTSPRAGAQENTPSIQPGPNI